MERIPLYAGLPIVAVQEVDPLARDDRCTACALHKGASTVCMPNRYVRGSGSGCLLVVGEFPSVASDRKGLPFETRSERWFVSELRKVWRGNIVLTYAIRCLRKSRTINQTHHNHCRPYLADVFEDIDPDRVLLLGNHAAKGFLGYDRGGSAHCNRRGYTWVWHDGKQIPAFIMSRPDDPSGNKFLRDQFLSDLRWACESSPPKPPVDSVAYALEPTEADADFLRDYLSDVDWFSIDVETYGQHFFRDFKVLSVAIRGAGKDDCVALCDACLETESPTWWALREVCQSERWAKKGQNIKYDHISLRLGPRIELVNVFGDTRLEYKLINPDGVAALDQLAELVGMGGHKQEAQDVVAPEARRLRKEWRAANPDSDARFYNAKAYAYAALPREIMLRYVARDALSTGLLAERFEDTLQSIYQGRLWRTYSRTVNPASLCITNIEANGVAIAADAVKAFGAELMLLIRDATAELDKYSKDEPINPASHASVSKFLYEDLQIKPLEYTKSGKPSTAKPVLERMRLRHPAIEHILEWRKLTKLLSTYVDGLLPHIREDGRIHPTFLLDGTGTGRLSCKNPNLQNQPSRGGKTAKMLKDCFAAPPGRTLLQVDYGTLEIRVAAILSKDPKMIELLRSGADFHLGTAKLIAPSVWGISGEQVEAEFLAGDKTKRSIAKTINFGTLYGQSAPALAALISASLGETFASDRASKAQIAILGQFDALREWIVARRKETAQYGEAWTYWSGDRARRRPLYAAGFQDDSERSGTAMRSAYNTPIQGTGSDYCLMSLIECEKALREDFGPLAFPVLTVHDSILFELRDDPDVIADVVGIVHDIMTGWESGDVPLVVDFELGRSWGSMEPLTVINGNLEVPRG